MSATADTGRPAFAKIRDDQITSRPLVQAFSVGSVDIRKK
jgi:hypothetical protein